MAINIIIRVLNSVSGEAQLSPFPPMYPDKAPPLTKRERQTPPGCSGFWGVHVRKPKEWGARWLPTCVPGFNAKSKVFCMTFSKSTSVLFSSSSPTQGTIQVCLGRVYSFRFPETLVKWSCSLIKWRFPNHLFISTKHHVVYITANTTSDLSLRILKVVQTTQQ